MGRYSEKEKLLVSIDEKRKLMIDAAKKHGFTGYDTIRHSQELDCLMNEYHQLMQEKEPSQGIQGFVKKLGLWSRADVMPAYEANK
ncbi:aspartyl-phosphate phosphatase Spo0E family protein [Bacillus sp. ISL-32]|uniref:aspartyl-phosphate phosphatase Spo0E family protein n=1 Tax=Bacillus atrophaeus TaxID=1452 RepID=UPI001BEBBE94|nr:aspartyl-phosphate phosphatase Spo0E family protein [Bacillus atrophaeus]MBT2624588.1 aspartyl-phosphate phosphatase Spo0E family protein [Bacillus sp. ISL-32]MCG8395501.1 aspartyl-phosphate phosphatase Spo0E family protein [Bacillus atrophaeus]